MCSIFSLPDTGVWAHISISWPNSSLVLELGDGASGPQVRLARIPTLNPEAPDSHVHTWMGAFQLMLHTLVLGDLRQLWRFVRCPQPEPEPQPKWAPQLPKAIEAVASKPQAVASASVEPGKGIEVVVESARAESDPTTTETVAVSESVDYITTTRTTTTTVITTVTEVVRTPKALLPR